MDDGAPTERCVLRLDKEKDPEILRKAALILEQENKRLLALVLDLQRKLLLAQGKGENTEQLALRLAELEQQLNVRNRLLLGSSSEKRPGNEPASSKPQKAERKKTGHGPREQTQLRTVETVHELDDADKVYLSCGGELKEWDGQTEDSEEVDVIAREFVIRNY